MLEDFGGRSRRLQLLVWIGVLAAIGSFAVAYAKPVTPIEAENVADGFLVAEGAKGSMYAFSLGIPDDVSLETRKALTDPATHETLAYVFELTPTGYIVVPADSGLVPILAYSFSSAFPWDDIPENILLDMLRQDLANRFLAAKDGSLEAAVATANAQAWEDLLALDSQENPYQQGVYGPWTTDSWNQGDPYWDHCPLDPVTGSRCWVGCPATALAQILNYWQYPSSVTFLPSDDYLSVNDPQDGLGVRTIPIIASTANFSGMNYNDCNPSDWSKAALSYAAGVSLRVQYSSEGSGSGLTGVASALAGTPTPFSFDPPERWGYYSADFRSASAENAWMGSPYYVSSTVFYEELMQNMKLGRPAEMGVSCSNETCPGAHAIVVDGYNPSDGTYHLNYGWGGYADGWYDLPSGMPEGYDVVGCAIYNIIPTSKTYAISTSTSGTGNGSVEVLPGPGPLTRGTHVLMSAVPAPGSSFSHWTGALSGSDNPAMLILDDNKNVNAVFSSGQVLYRGTAGGTTSYADVTYRLVDVDEVVMGGPPCAYPIRVVVAGGLPQSGVVDPTIVAGDRVEVHGIQSNDIGGCMVSLPDYAHYIRRVPDDVCPTTCACDSWIHGEVQSEPEFSTLDVPPVTQGWFDIRITKVLKEPYDALEVGTTIRVYVSELAQVYLEGIHLGDEVSVCGGWDTDIFVPCPDSNGFVCDLGGETGVQFSDPGLEAAVRNALGKPTGTIHQTDLAGLTTLDATGRGIVDLEGIQYCVNLVTLYLANNSIANLAQLAALAHLRTLHLYSNAITDIAPLSGLIGLRQLELYANGISDINPLAGLLNLTLLDLHHNQIEDISALVGNAGIGNGDTLNVAHNYLNLAIGGPAMTAIGSLIGRGVDITYLPQLLPACAITVQTPNGGEQWQQGSAQTITWTSQSVDGNVRIDYSINNGASWLPVATTANDGSHSWTVPNVESTQCLVRVWNAADASCSDTSDSVFTISNVPPPFWCDNFEVLDGWTADGLWHRTIAKSQSATHSYWFAHGDSEVYGPGDVSGWLTSPSIPVSPGACTLDFYHWRHVESYSGGAYDRTNVEVRYGSGAWTQVWAQDSKVASQQAWEAVSVDLNVPAGTSTLQVRFGFDSVDDSYNNFTGWFIDDVCVTAGAPLPCAITVQTPNGGEQWQQGSAQTITWTSQSVDGNVRIDYSINNGASWLPVATTANDGSHSWTVPNVESTQCLVRVWNAADASCSDTSDGVFTISGNCPCVLAQIDFSDGLTGQVGGTWTAEGDLWHIAENGCATDCGALDDEYAYFGKESTCNYNTGARVLGYLISSALPVDPCIEKIAVSFDYFCEVEAASGDAYDRAYIQVRWDGGTWETYWLLHDSNDPGPICGSATGWVPVPDGATSMQIRFSFDSVDAYFNSFRGWAVDNISILNDTCALASSGPSMAPLAAAPSAEERRPALEIFNIPNPVQDVNTTTFVVRGEGIESIRVQVYDLNETLVFEQEVPGNELIWDTANNYGQYLADGVYFYRAMVVVDGELVATAFRKLVILR